MSRTAFVPQTVVCCGSRIFFCRKTPCPSCPSSPKKPFVHSEPSSCLPSCAHVQKGLRLCIYIYIIGWNLKPDMSCMLHANYLPLLDAQMISKNWWPCNKLHNIYINIFPPHWPLKKGRSKTSKLRRPQAEEIQLIQRSTKPILQILRVTSACCFEGYNVCFGHLRFLVWNICESHPLDHFNSLYHFAWHLCARNNMCTSCRST